MVVMMVVPCSDDGNDVDDDDAGENDDHVDGHKYDVGQEK